MNRKFILALLSSPVLFMSVLSTVMMTRPADASQITHPDINTACIPSPHTATHTLVCIKVNNKTASASRSQIIATQIPPNQITELKFSDQDSDEAIKLFGCDCPACLNAARQLNGLALIPV